MSVESKPPDEQMRQPADSLRTGPSPGLRPGEAKERAPARSNDTRALLRLTNVAFDIEAAAVGVISAVGFVLNPDSVLDLFGVAFPYNHTVLIWIVSYLLVRRFYPIKQMFFLFLWGFQELAWNLVYFAARYPESLAWGATQGILQWERYTAALVVISALGLAVIRRKLTIDWRWAGGFMVFEALYFLAGVPIVNDRLTNAYIPGNWVWEVVYNIVAMAFYLGIFRERTPEPVAAVGQTPG